MEDFNAAKALKDFSVFRLEYPGKTPCFMLLHDDKNAPVENVRIAAMETFNGLAKEVSGPYALAYISKETHGYKIVTVTPDEFSKAKGDKIARHIGAYLREGMNPERLKLVGVGTFIYDRKTAH